MEKEELATDLLKWFETHHRSFPWRDGKFNRFQLLLTEFLLQRTKAETVNAKAIQFINKHNTPIKIMAKPVDQIMTELEIPFSG